MPEERNKCGHNDCFTCPFPDCNPKYYFKKIDPAKAAKLHAEGWTDAQMAAEFICTRSSVINWREKHGLAANKKAPIGRRGKHG